MMRSITRKMNPKPRTSGLINLLTCKAIDLPKRLAPCSMLFALCSLLFALCSPVHAAPPFWTQSQQLSLGSAYSSEPDACARDSEVYVVWSDNRVGNREIFFAASMNAGQTWGSEERLTETSAESTQPAIACDRRNVHVVWREKDEDTSQICYKSWDGSEWSDEMLLSDSHQNSRRPDIAATTLFPGSYIYVVWDSDEDGKTRTYLIRSSDGGQSFSEPQSVTTGDWSTKEPAVWGGARDAYVVWADNREGNWHIFLRKWGEARPGPEVKLSALPDCRSPAIAGVEPSIYPSWQCVEKGAVYADIHSSFSLDNGSTWAGSVKLTEAEAESVSPKIIVSERIPWIFWQDGRNGEWQILFSMLDTTDGAVDVQFLTDTDKPAISPDIVSTSGQIHTFWTRLESDSRANVMYARRDTLPPERPGTPSHFDLTAVPGYDDDSQVTFSWEQSAGAVKYNVYSQADSGDFQLIGSTGSTSYDVPGESGKTYRIYLEAVDEVDNVSLQSGVSAKIMCDPDVPEVAIHSPGPNSTIRGAIPVIATVHDANLLEYIVEYGASALPSTWLALAGPFQEELDWKRVVTWETSKLNGIYTIRISARDKAGNESRAKAVVNIDSQPPIALSPGEFAPLTDPDAEWTYGMPEWSPAGDKIAFHSDEGGTEDIWVMSSDGVNRTRLTRSPAVEHNPAWSPDGEMIAFQSFTEDDSWDIWVMKADGGDAQRITWDISWDTNPVWSPDGSSIAFDSDRDGDSEIFIITSIQRVLAGNEPEFSQLTDNDWEDKYPTWSPDGSKIVFQSSRRGNWDLFEIGVDGANLNITFASPADEIEPRWSPDRKRLLFSTNELGHHYEIRAIDWPEASTQVRLSPEGEDAHHAHWSPAMDAIVYEHAGGLYSAGLVYPSGKLEAIIYWPRGGEVLTGGVDIEGIARGADFSRYSLQFSSVDSTDFQLIGGESTSPVPERGFLGRWSTEGLEGEYSLKLVVAGKDGDRAEDSVRVLIVNQLPFMLVDEPQNGLVTNQSIITVSGRTGQRVIVTLNDSEIPLNPDGSFARKVQLEEGSNSIIIKARSPSDQNGEYVVTRTVTLDTQPPGITLESPMDFQVIHVPYVTVKGSVNERAEVSVLSKRVWPDGNGSFQREVLCSEGTNLISVTAFDELGHYKSITRRVIFQRETDIISDTSAPAVVDVFPDTRAVVTGRSLRVSATLIDDIGLDPLAITFSFDDEEIDSEEYGLDIRLPDAEETFPPDQYPILHFTYNPSNPVTEGDHSFKIGLEDTSGNASESSFSFFVDTVPSELMVSAVLEGTNKIKVTATANKPLIGISRAAAYSPQSQDGYSLSSFVQKDDHYEAFLSISPSQKNFVIDLTAKTYLGAEISAHGYITWHKSRPGETIDMGIEGGPGFSSEMVSDRLGDVVLMLRSQDGLDTDLVALQRSDAELRRIELSDVVYVLSLSEEFAAGDLQGFLSLPVDSDTDLSAAGRRPVMFYWNEDLDQWQALDRLGLSEGTASESASTTISQIMGTGIYALFNDKEPPTIKDVSPVDAEEVPMSKFFVEASVSDSGSGISEIIILVDGRRVGYDYDPVEGRLLYYPSALEWGFHNMEITAVDRAGNVTEFATSFVTKESFQFISVRAYPNPANAKASIEFRLTRVADVTLRIYTIAGKLVYTSEQEKVAEGKFIWECENNAGNRIASGIYIYSVEALLYDTSIREKGIIAVVM